MPRIGTVIREAYRRPGAELLPQHLEDRYGIRITATTRLDAGVLRIDREDGPPWVARLFLPWRPYQRTEDDAEVLRFVERNGIEAERCAHPEPVSSLDGRAVLVTEFVAGTKPASSPAARRKLGDMLGRIHALATEPGPTSRAAGALHHLPDYEGGPAQDLAASAALLADLDGRVPPKHQRVYESLLELLARSDDCTGLPEGFVHPDPARSNLVAGAGGKPVLVDWTGAGKGPRLASLVVLLWSVGAKGVEPVLDGYRIHVALTPEELDRVEGALWIRALWLACWECWLAVVSSRVDRVRVPDQDRIAAVAAEVRRAAHQPEPGSRPLASET